MRGSGKLKCVLVGVFALGAIGLVNGLAASASAAGVCDPIVAASNRVTKAQLAFTVEAYSDGEITPAEAAEAERFSQLIQKITEDLATCINTGKLPAGYPPDGLVSMPGPPVANHFNVELAKWRIGDRAVTLNWETSEPTKVWIGFYKGDQFVGSLSAPQSARSVEFKGKLGKGREPRPANSSRKPVSRRTGIKVKPGRYTLSSSRPTQTASSLTSSPRR